MQITCTYCSMVCDDLFPLQWFLVNFEGDQVAICVFSRLLQASGDLEKTRKEIHKTLQPIVETRWHQMVVKNTPGGIQKDQLGWSYCSATGVTPFSTQKEVQIPLFWGQKDKLQREGKEVKYNVCITFLKDYSTVGKGMEIRLRAQF